MAPRACEYVDVYRKSTYTEDGDLLKGVPMAPCSDADHWMRSMLYRGNADGVYLILNPDSGLCKVGKTKDIVSRVANLQTACGSRLELLLYLELEPGRDESAMYVEKTLHRILSHKRTVGEWFKLDVRDICAVRDIFYSIGGLDLVEHEAWYDQGKDKRPQLLKAVRK